MIAILLLSTSIALSQSKSFGIKGGLNYGTAGDITTFGDFTTNFKIDGEDKVGYHIGLFGKFEFAGLFLQPEIAYTKLTTSYDNRDLGFNSENYNFSKIDVPILLGAKIIGPLNIKAGPSFQYIVNNEFDDLDIDLEDPENSFTVGYQVGAGVTLGQLGLDLRYEGSFTDNTVVTSNQVESNEFGFTIDTRPSQWILSLSYTFDKN